MDTGTNPVAESVICASCKETVETYSKLWLHIKSKHIHAPRKRKRPTKDNKPGLGARQETIGKLILKLANGYSLPEIGFYFFPQGLKSEKEYDMMSQLKCLFFNLDPIIFSELLWPAWNITKFNPTKTEEYRKKWRLKFKSMHELFWSRLQVFVEQKVTETSIFQMITEDPGSHSPDNNLGKFFLTLPPEYQFLQEIQSYKFTLKTLPHSSALFLLAFTKLGLNVFENLRYTMTAQNNPQALDTVHNELLQFILFGEMLEPVKNALMTEQNERKKAVKEVQGELRSEIANLQKQIEDLIKNVHS
jgi:hypothetical protein